MTTTLSPTPGSVTPQITVADLRWSPHGVAWVTGFQCSFTEYEPGRVAYLLERFADGTVVASGAGVTRQACLPEVVGHINRELAGVFPDH